MNFKKAVVFIKDNGRTNTEIQEEKCFEFAEENDIEIVKVIKEFEGVFDLGIDYVLVYDFSRLARSSLEILLTIQALKEKNIGLITAKHGMEEFKMREHTHNIIDKLKTQN